LQLDKFLIGLLIIGLVIFTGVGIITDADNNYDDFNLTSDENAEFAGIYAEAGSLINETYNTAEGIKNETLGGNVDEDESWDSMIKGGYSAIRLVTGSFGLTVSILREIQEVLGFPSYFIDVAFAIMVILVIFALIYLIFRFRG